MKHLVAAIALAVTLAQPASAITFPSLTTIYVGSGVTDSGGAAFAGISSAFICSNVSGQSATLRFLVLGRDGELEASSSTTIPHGGTRVAATHLSSGFVVDLNLETGSLVHGVVNIESTQSGVFCNAVVTDANTVTNAYPLRLVRVNPHPGTLE